MLKQKKSGEMDFIERYFNEELSQEELDFFNEQLIKDPDFALKVEQFAVVFKALSIARTEKLRSQFLVYESQYNTRQKNLQISSIQAE
tara:strand:+ start:4046 stop:4309 length:264 start_codon:yes stop_codon:yes gene_type:complete